MSHEAGVQIIHKGAHLCPVSETEEKRLWARKFQLYKQSKQRETKENTSYKSCDDPWKEGDEVITKKGVHKHNKSAQTLNTNMNTVAIFDELFFLQSAEWLYSQFWMAYENTK